jgi:hypothetical protein
MDIALPPGRAENVARCALFVFQTAVGIQVHGQLDPH